MYVCGNYAKQPVGTLCQSVRRIKADHVMEIVAKTIKEVIQYAGLDKGHFAEEIQSHIEDREKGIYFHAGMPNIPRAGNRR